MGEHPVGQQIIDLLVGHGNWHEAFEHAPVRTSEDAAKLRTNYTMQQAAKAIIVRVKIPNVGKKFVMLVMPATSRFDSAMTKQALSSKDLRFATETEVVDLTGGVQPGGVPPFGNLFGLKVYCDPSLFLHETIVFNAGRDLSIAMKSSDYRQHVSPIVVKIV